MTSNSAAGIRWDLNDLYAGHDDPRIDATLNECYAKAERFAGRFRPLMQNPETLTADAVLEALKSLETIYEALGRAGSYAGLLYAARTLQNPSTRTWSKEWSSAPPRFATCCFSSSSNGSRSTIPLPNGCLPVLC